MTPDQQRQIDQHVQAIAELLYADADPNELKTLSDIEVKIRQQLQDHVSPNLGLFLSNALWVRFQDTHARSKASWAASPSAAPKPNN